MNRRQFLAGTAAAGAAATLSKPGAAGIGPNDIVNVAIVGIRGESQGQPTWTRLGRGQDHYAGLSGVKNARITHVVDIDERHFATVLPKLKSRWGGDPKTETDVRRILDNRDVDAITIAVPDHWHALMTVWACQAGKDVYVEKPVCHNLFEGRKMVEAARKYKRVVQAGTQRRSNQVTKEAIKFLQSGGLGKLYAARCSVLRPRDPIGHKPDSAVPEGVHYDLWLGPAPQRPFNELRFHYTWHWFWDYGDADLGNNGVHVLDILRWGIGKREHPRRIHCAGGLFDKGAPTDQETPNTQYVTFEYADGTNLRCDVQGWYGGSDGGGSFIYGTDGWMDLGGREGPKIFLGRKNEPGPDLRKALAGGRLDDDEGPDPHFHNFIECVRSRKWQDLAADVEEGYMSTALCHLGNISYRLKRPLVFDGRSERFPDDAEANRFLTREYRRPFVVPEKV
jgi:predicted dehydrogenase